jgi:CheY-like chemotaxis protein
MIRTLIVEDDALVARTMGRLLSRHLDIVDAVTDGESALRRVELDQIELVITDFDLGPGMTGVDLAHRIREARPNIRIIMVSGSFQSGEEPPMGQNDDIDAFLAKPTPIPELIATIRRVTKLDSAP